MERELDFLRFFTNFGDYSFATAAFTAIAILTFVLFNKSSFTLKFCIVMILVPLFIVSIIGAHNHRYVLTFLPISIIVVAVAPYHFTFIKRHIKVISSTVILFVCLTATAWLNASSYKNRIDYFLKGYATKFTYFENIYAQWDEIKKGNENIKVLVVEEKYFY